MRDQFRVQCKDCPYVPKSAGPKGAEIATENNKNPCGSKENTPGPQKACGDCLLLNHHSECEQVKGSHFYRDKADKACKAGFVQREAI